MSQSGNPEVPKTPQQVPPRLPSGTNTTPKSGRGPSAALTGSKGSGPPGKRPRRSTKNLLKRPSLADFSFKTPRIRYSKLVRWSLSYSRPNPWGSNPVLSRLKINVHEDKRKTFFNDLNFPRIWPKLCQNEAQDHSSLGAKDEPCSYKSVLKRAV